MRSQPKTCSCCLSPQPLDPVEVHGRQGCEDRAPTGGQRTRARKHRLLNVGVRADFGHPLMPRGARFVAQPRAANVRVGEFVELSRLLGSVTGTGGYRNARPQRQISGSSRVIAREDRFV